MYPLSLYNAFVQLRKQLYKCKTRKGLDRYSKIENYEAHYRTYERFYDESREFLSSIFTDRPIEKTTQEVFEEMLEKSQKNRLKRNVY